MSGANEPQRIGVSRNALGCDRVCEFSLLVQV